MGFLKPDVPPPPVLPPAPEIIEVPLTPQRSDAEIQAEKEQKRRLLASAQGRSSTLLGGQTGAAGSAVGGGTLLGG